MPLYGLIGYPLSHSLSQAYFREKFRKENITGSDYEVFPIKSISELPALLQQHPTLAGLNVTIPYKESVLPFAHERDAVVEACGAANCLKINNGKISAFNTDAIGFETSLKPLLLPEHSRALILGTGGAAKAVGWVLQQLGIQYLFVTRQSEKITEQTILYASLSEEILSEYFLIINASPAGMSPNENTFPEIKYSCITPRHLLYDLVYNPEKTVFLQKGEERGAAIKNGYEMLLLQAEAGWMIWNDEKPGLK